MKPEELLSKLKFLNGVLHQPEHTEMDERLYRLSKLINEKIPDTLKKNAPPEFYELHMDFHALYGQFCNFVLYDELIGKNVIALGGGFSSGKSSFLNALNGESALPIKTDPSTAVPTFIVNGEKHHAFGINVFDAKVKVDFLDIPKISHGFGEVKDGDGNLLVESVTLGHVIKSIFLASPKQKYANLAFVDTPGFSKPETSTYSAKTDEHISRGQLNISNCIIMFIQSDAGTLSDDFINFVKSLQPEIPKLFIVSKADKKSESELSEIVDHIKSKLAMSGIASEGVLTFSAEKPAGYAAAAIREILDAWNEKQQAPQFSRDFKKLFIYCRAYYEKEIEEERRRLEQLNTSLTKITDEDEGIVAPLRKLAEEIKRNIGELQKVYAALKDLNKEFFTELKKVCDHIGINMPEPSEADMYEDKPDVLAMMREYKKAKGIKTNRETLAMLKNTFSGVVPKFDNTAGGSAHRENIMKLIREHCKVDAENIRINDAAYTADRMRAELIKQKAEGNL